jgi:adenylosuccinate synthase
MVNNSCEQAQPESLRGAVLMARQATTARKRPAAKAPAAKASTLAARSQGTTAQGTTAQGTVPAGKASTARGGKTALSRLDGLSSEQKIARLLDEREKLTARVMELEAEIVRQKAKHAEVADRIAWTLDLLKDVMASKA